LSASASHASSSLEDAHVDAVSQIESVAQRVGHLMSMDAKPSEELDRFVES